jgi:hypothetical protein
MLQEIVPIPEPGGVALVVMASVALARRGRQRRA